MLLSKFVETKMGGTNVVHFKKLGYQVKLYEIIIVPICHLSENSHEKVVVQCDYCGKIILKEYKNLLIEREKSFTKKDCCSNCIHIKDVETNLSKYGVKSVMLYEKFKEKQKESLLNNYGVENPSQSPIIQKTIADNYIKKYGVSSYTKTQEYKDRVKKTNLDKYGKETYLQSDDYKEKTKKTLLERYGTDNVASLESCKNKRKETLIEKYGEDNYFKTDLFKENNKKYCQETYGVDHFSQTSLFKEKSKNTWESKTKEELEEIKNKKIATCLKKYGYESPLQVPEFRKRLADTNGISISSQQQEIYNILTIYFDTIYLNYSFSDVFLDIAIFTEDNKINIEYDGWYWHNDIKDRRRDEYLKSEGWKILRIKSGRKIPDEMQLIYILEDLILGDHRYNEIILDDWGKGEQIERSKNESLSNTSG